MILIVVTVILIVLALCAISVSHMRKSHGRKNRTVSASCGSSSHIQQTESHPSGFTFNVRNRENQGYESRAQKSVVGGGSYKNQYGYFGLTRNDGTLVARSEFFRDKMFIGPEATVQVTAPVGSDSSDHTIRLFTTNRTSASDEDVRTAPAVPLNEQFTFGYHHFINHPRSMTYPPRSTRAGVLASHLLFD